MSSQLPKPLKTVLDNLRKAVVNADGSSSFLHEAETALGLVSALVRDPSTIEPACVAVMLECHALNHEIALAKQSRVAPEQSIANARDAVFWAVRDLIDVLRKAEASDYALLRGLSWTRRQAA